MKLEGLKIFQRQLNDELSRDDIAAHIYFVFEGKWNDLQQQCQCTDREARDIEKSKIEGIAYHAASSLDSWFYLETKDVAIRLTFPQSPQLATRKKYRERILKIQESASNEYKVSHNPLTQLLARDAFREQLTDSIRRIFKSEAQGHDAQESSVPRALAVLALDIDHFKQVNDTWGHLYGDQVLKAFGRRLENCAEQIRQNGFGNPQVMLGHPSGEEFLVVLEANAGREQFIDWANEFRRTISDDVMPTDKEWQWLSESGGTGSLSPPPLHERSTTASIGLAMISSTPLSDTGIDIVSDLLDRADTALYRAKAAGRNQAIAFDEILSTCGRVLEQDPSTKVVALDIGSNVGVSIGQEFKVFLPTFTGKAKFHLNDGRTKRTLGHYPRVESTRIVVFNTQPEISFAFIESPSEPVSALEPGSHLEAIPAGSIGHLLPSSSKYFPASPDTNDKSSLRNLQEFIKEESKAGSPFAVVIRFSKEAEHLRKYGSVALNKALAHLYREAQSLFHAARSTEVLDRGSICIVGAKSSYEEALVASFVNQISQDLPELGVVAGVFCDTDREASAAEGQLELNPTNAIEFARFAASDAGRNPDNQVRHFSYATAQSALQALRKSKSFELAYTDFERLRKMGVESASFLNLGGLVASSSGHRQEAFELYAAAMAKAPTSLIYKSNYGTVAYKLGEIDSALKVLNTLPLDEVDKLRSTHPFGYFSYARLLARAKLNGSQMFDADRFKHVATATLAIPEYESAPEAKIIHEALNESR